MFSIGRNRFINKPEVAKYLKESLHKSLTNCNEKFTTNNKKYNNFTPVCLENPDPNNSYFLLPFVSLFSFLAGYNFRSLFL